MTSRSEPVVTRFAPSPTGFLHIGGARTALFNWLYARHEGGRFRLRIEDTDRERSTQAAIDAIIDGLQWLGLDWDDAVVHQSTQIERHTAAAQRLLDSGKAYYCYCSPEELAEMRATARAEGRSKMYDGRWRDRDPGSAPPGVQPVVRIKMPLDGETRIEDRVQGPVTVANAQLDDMVLLRADGTPTYMLSVVVDDHDMDVTHVIRGDDHLTNAFRQTQLFHALGWAPPTFAHLPLIHGPDGAKLSKRHGALGVEAYRDMGYLPEALRNYLMRLGWSHGDEEIISTEQAITWFDFKGVGKSPARFDFAKLDSLNGHYLRACDNARLVGLTIARLESADGVTIGASARARLAAGLHGLKERAKNIQELTEKAHLYLVERPLSMDDKAAKILSDQARGYLTALAPRLGDLPDWQSDAIEAVVRTYAEEAEIKLGQIAQPLRAALSGSNVSPGIFEVMLALGRDEALARIRDQCG